MMLATSSNMLSLKIVSAFSSWAKISLENSTGKQKSDSSQPAERKKAQVGMFWC